MAVYDKVTTFQKEFVVEERLKFWCDQKLSAQSEEVRRLGRKMSWIERLQRL